MSNAARRAVRISHTSTTVEAGLLAQIAGWSAVADACRAAGDELGGERAQEQCDAFRDALHAYNDRNADYAALRCAS